MTVTLFVGSYTYTTPNNAHREEGISIFEFEPESGELKLISKQPAGKNPSFLSIHPNGQYLYAVNELGEGTVSAFQIDHVSKTLTFLNRQVTSGSAPCYVSCDRDGKWLMVSNYGNGSLAIYPINKDGTLEPHSDSVQHQGSGPDAVRQEGAHAHSIISDLQGEYILAADLGLDKVLLYTIDENSGKLRPHSFPSLSVPPGSGPRHMVFHPNNKYFYVANEMGNTVTACTWSQENGVLDAFQTLPTLPSDFSDNSSVADIHISPGGKFLYVSNRGHNSLAVFMVQEDGSLVPSGHVSSAGRWPRNFALTPSGSHLIAANEHTDNLVVFSLDDRTGIPEPTGINFEVPKPVCILPVLS